MPTAGGDVIETAVNWDHDAGMVSVSTRRKAVISKLRKLGLEPIREEIGGYTTFEASDTRLKISFRGPKNLSDEQRKAAGERLKKARSLA